MQLTVNERFEIKAAAFYKQTGVFAPGKDLPHGNQGVAPGWSHEERKARWDEWLGQHGSVIDAVIDAVEDQVLSDFDLLTDEPEWCDEEDDECREK